MAPPATTSFCIGIVGGFASILAVSGRRRRAACFFPSAGRGAVQNGAELKVRAENTCCMSQN